jgi:hypothetical protein
VGNLAEKAARFIGDRERKAKGMENGTKKLDTTLGDLIAAASEVAFEYSDNDKEAYQLARLALIEILRKSSHPTDLTEDLDWPYPRKPYLN